MLVSIFNDVIGPVMRGPSSSHCAAALRIGRTARDLMNGRMQGVAVDFDRGGSLPTTHQSQGSDMGLFGGLLGWEAADPRLPEATQALAEAGIQFRFNIVDNHDPHPNTYNLTVFNDQESHRLTAISTGGGMIEVLSIDEFKLSMFGDCFATLIWIDADCGPLLELAGKVDHEGVFQHTCNQRHLIEIRTMAPLAPAMLAEIKSLHGVNRVRTLAPVLPVMTRKTTAVPFKSCTELLEHDGRRNTPLWRLAIEYEQARSGLSEAEIVAKMVELVQILRSSIAQGIRGTFYADRVLGHQSGRFAEMMDSGKLLNGGALNRVVLYVTAMMEVKSSLGVIIAAPTAGACAALPGAVIGMAEEMGLTETEMAKAMLAAGLIGVFIATAWTFAAEVGGCQAEGGSAASMAAAALVTLAQGSRDQGLGAASMAMQSMLGLICDPVGNRVEVPCLGKNVMAASNALSCANMALAGFDAVIPLDEVIDAARRVAMQMPRELRCTAMGGLSTTPTSLEIERRLAQATTHSCGCDSGRCGT